MNEPGNSFAPLTFRCTIVATILSVLGVAGSLWLSIGMQLKACPLCLYQRSFVMAAAAVFLIGLLTDIRRSAILPLLALPATVGGAGVAVFHEYLELAGKLECPAGLLGMGSAPQQSLAILSALLVITLMGTTPGSAQGSRIWQVASAFVLGLMLSAGTIKSAPPMPAAPTKPYDQPLEICRPPFRSAA